MLKDSLLKFFKIDGLIENLSGYLETRVELLKLELKEELTRSIAKLSVVISGAAFLLIAFIFMSVGLAFYIGQVLNYVAGFVIVGALYLMIAIAILIYKEPIGKILEKRLGDIVKEKKHKRR